MKNKKMKSMLVLMMAALLLTVAVGSTLAYLLDTTDPVTNTFTPAHVTCEVIEPGWKDGPHETKENVTIKNTGNILAYIRAAVSANWCNASGQIIRSENISFAAPEGWTKSGDYYYHTAPVPARETTSVLIGSYTPSKPADLPDGTYLEMVIICQAIQAEGMGATSAVNAFERAASGN